MNFLTFAAFGSVAMLIGCSQIQSTIRNPASVTDVGVIGPNGDVILFYKESNHIVIKNCNPNTILGSTPVQARANCQGRVNKVPVESFKRVIRNLISVDRLDVLRPLTPEQIQLYSRDGLSAEQISAIEAELEKINVFIRTYGAENANLVRRDELLQALRSNEARVNILKKINAEIEKTLNLIIDQNKLTITKSNSDKNQFLYTVLKNFDPSRKFPCGLKGSLDERIKDCSYQSNSEKKGFVLVSRTKEFDEVHRDIETGLIWSDRIPSAMVHYDALKSCKSDLREVSGIKGAWRLPSIEEYEVAEKNGIRKALPNMNYRFWSSTVKGYYTGLAWLFNGINGEVDSHGRYNGYSVRCVTR